MTDSVKYTGKLRGQRVLIFGGTSGIGYAVAEGCLENGMVVAIASSSQSKIDASLASLGKTYPSAAAQKRLSGHVCDLNDGATLESNIVRVLDAATRKGAEKLDHVISTAGNALAIGSLEGVSVADIQQAGMVRYFAPLMLAKHLPTYAHADGSLVLTTGSVSEKPMPGWAAINGYATGLHGLARGLALDLKPQRVNTVSPGAVATPLWDPIPEAQRQKLLEHHASNMTTGRIGQPEDVAEAYLYLLRDRNCTGTIIRTDGGGMLT